jgi:hypothetical protein
LRGCFLQVPEASSRFHARVPIGHASSRKRTPGRVIPRETWSGARDKASPPGARHLRRQGIPDAAAVPPFTRTSVYIWSSASACLPIKQRQSCSQISKSTRNTVHRRKSSSMDPRGRSYEDFKPPHRLVREPLTHTLSIDLANQGTHLSLSPCCYETVKRCKYAVLKEMRARGG